MSFSADLVESDGREQAEKLITGIARRKGWISEAQRQFLSVNLPEVIESLDGARSLASSATKALSDNLYQKNTRFVYELIQNAEDNSYDIARKQEKLPALTFTVSKDKIVINSNENGFTEANVTAICDVGKSTKSNVHGYIGEKGIGFKSVFKVARRVQVRSGAYSFAFDYNHELPDSGLGMVTPLLNNYNDLPVGIRTSMILSLRSDCNTDELIKEFLTLPDTFLLFLGKLKEISFCIERAEQTAAKTIYTILSDKERTIITKTTQKTEERYYFSVARKLIEDMPKDDKRMIKKEKKKEKEDEPFEWISKAEVVLAFPLNLDYVPVTELQHVFAYLPLRKVGFKFILQSDFITQANREDIADTPWNRRIFDEIVALFIVHVWNLRSHQTLRCHWIRYLTVDAIADEFWGMLQRKLIEDVKRRNLYCSQGQTPCWIKDLRIVPDWLRDEDGKPLLPDCHCADCGAGAYISEQYDKQIDIPILKRLGVKDLSSEDFVHKLKVDLDREDAVMWSQEVTDSWITLVSEVLLKMMNTQNNPYRLIEQIKLLPIIPLIGKKPAQIKGASIYLPTVGEIDIPRDLPLALVQPEALRNEARTKLFTKMKIGECGVVTVIQLLADASRRIAERPVSLAQSLKHIEFLFLHRDKIPSPAPSIQAFDIDGHKFNPDLLAGGWVYSPFYVEKYFLATILNAKHNKLPTELHGKLRVLNLAYYDALDSLGTQHRIDLGLWLSSFFHLRVTVPLYSRQSSSNLAPELEWLLEHKSEYTIGILSNIWSDLNLDRNRKWKDQVCTSLVPIINSKSRMPLKNAYLPVSKLMEIVSSLRLEVGFGFLSELEHETDWTKWVKFRDLGIGVEDDLTFWLHIFKKAKSATSMDAVRMGKIYSNLQRLCQMEEDEKILLDTCEIFISGRNGKNSSQWFRSVQCLWDGPSWYNSRPLVIRVSEYASLYHLFGTILRVKRADLSCYLDDLALLKVNENQKDRAYVKEETQNLYKEIVKELHRDDSSEILKSIRTRFTDDKLIYDARRQTWQSPNDCIWAHETIQLTGKFSMIDQYGGLASLFSAVLNINPPSLDLHIKGLKHAVAASPQVEDVKQRIRNICQLKPEESDVEQLLKCSCLPVNCTNKSLAWMSSEDDFVIADRKEYSELFKHKINILAFSLEEVHDFKPFLVGLLGKDQDRYLSRNVEATTSAEDGEIFDRLTADLRRKAYAILRFAVHHGEALSSDKMTKLFEGLENLKVFSSKTIHRVLTAYQGEVGITVQAEMAFCHIKLVNKTAIEIYVPKDKRDLDLCLATHLPLAMLDFLGTRGPDIREFPSIISAKSLAVVDAILDTAGIINLVGVGRPQEDDIEEDDTEEDDTEEDDNEELPAAQRTTRPDIPSFITDNSRLYATFPARSLSRPRSAGYTVASESNLSFDFAATPATSVFDSLTPGLQAELYKQLLTAVVDAARTLTVVPQCDRTAIITSVASLLSPTDVDSAVRTSNRNNQVGAAGELFVFEWLKSLNLPNFQLSNWQSNIRGLVRHHPSYQGLQDWPNPETSDIVYHDTEGVLTRLLVNHGYLRSNIWNDQKPKYHIEVKATTNFSSTRFFVTQNQYDLMESSILPESNATGTVYLIARVSYLGRDGMGLKLYVDPANLRRKGELHFRSEQYEVFPRVIFQS